MNDSLEALEAKIKKGVLLKDYTTFKIGGPARYFLEAVSQEELAAGIKWAKIKKEPFFVLGGGSNLLVSDQGFKGLVIKLQTNNYKLQDNIIRAEAGVLLADLVKLCLQQGLSGFEWSSGIPRITVGGAVYGNAGAFGVTCADLIETVDVFNTNNLEVKTLDFSQCQFDYKESIFKKDRGLIILAAAFCLEPKPQLEIEQEMKRALAHRRNNHPAEPSAGSIFKNPFHVPAGELIEKCGLKGQQVGQALISEKHANFIVNLGQAKASDVLALINLAKQKAQQKFSIALEEEIQYLGF